MKPRRQPSKLARTLVCIALTGAIVAGPAAFGAVPLHRRPVVSAGSAIDLVLGSLRPAQRNLFERVTDFALGLSTPSPTTAPTAQPAVPTSAPEAIPTPTATPLPSSDPEEAPSTEGIWVSPADLFRLPTTGPAWQRLFATADGDLGVAQISNQDSTHNVKTLAVALVYARTRDGKYATKARNAIMSAIGTESGASALAVARNLASYVIAADLIELSGDDDARFRSWLARLLTVRFAEGRTLRETHEERPNNHGTHAGASRAAAAAYLGDAADLAQAAKVFRGWLGDRSSWSGFKFGSPTWHCDPGRPVPLNPAGCTKDGHSIDGVLPDDQRRGGTFAWPPPRVNYVYEALQGAVVQAEILHRAGFGTWEWQDRALLRAFRWLHESAAYPAQGDDQWQPWLVNRRLGSSFPAQLPARYGKNMGWTDWTHAP